jgi:hypothetical protein
MSGISAMPECHAITYNYFMMRVRYLLPNKTLKYRSYDKKIYFFVSLPTSHLVNMPFHLTYSRLPHSYDITIEVMTSVG